MIRVNRKHAYAMLQDTLQQMENELIKRDDDRRLAAIVKSLHGVVYLLASVDDDYDQRFTL